MPAELKPGTHILRRVCWGCIMMIITAARAVVAPRQPGICVHACGVEIKEQRRFSLSWRMGLRKVLGAQGFVGGKTPRWQIGAAADGWRKLPFILGAPFDSELLRLFASGDYFSLLSQSNNTL
jgi:hypothetical protein